MPSDYDVPTTEQVRAAYGDTWDDYRNVLEAAFGRWLAGVRAVAVEEAAEALHLKGVAGFSVDFLFDRADAIRARSADTKD